ncbi:clostripain-related cysteine peptidase [Microterricola viridarii]|uniref:Peptidase C11 n=1 Tax=Microterricola viridarii TaxID=412690 RepID=A0A0Y0Q1G8_9MICO|nr:clostripain-related cysteine peptidase [Microterricola viridarii]AMB59893.1 hypothetical protein AWU67_14660 [Microterricola viridarii]
MPLTMLPTTRGAARVSLAALLAVGVLVGASGCTAEQPASGEKGSWTVLTYAIADTDLEPYMMEDLDELGEVGSSDALNLVALVDRAEDYGDDPVLGMEGWSGARLLEVGKRSATVLEEMGDVNTGDPAVLAEFIERGIAEYPADNYALLISDHGASWPGVGGDESAHEDTLTLAELDQAIGDGLSAAGVDSLDLLGFDACLMATYEVASALAPHAQRLLASQELEPGHGWDYTALGILTDGGVSVDELGVAIIDGFEAQAQAEGTETEITLSLVDLTQMPKVDAALTNFTSVLTARAAIAGPVVGRTLAKTLGFGRSPDPTEDSHMADLGILAGEIGVDALYASDAADDLVRAINDAVVYKVDGQATRGATGLSIYFPPTPELFLDEYRELGNTGGWADFLLAFYGAGTDLPVDQAVRFNGGAAGTLFDEDGLTIQGTVDAALIDAIADSYIRYGIVEDDGSVSYIGQETATALGGDSGVVQGTYDLTRFMISDGEDSVPAYLQLAEESDGVISISAPMGYYAPHDIDGETYTDALLSLTVDADSGDVLSETYYSFKPGPGAYGQLSVKPTGLIVPEVLSVLEDGTEQWVAPTGRGVYAKLADLGYDFVPLASTTKLVIELWVVDFAGNSDMVSAQVEVP